MSLPITSQRAAGRSRCDGVDPGVDREWLPVHPTVPFESASGNDWKEATLAASRRLEHRQLCADTGHLLLDRRSPGSRGSVRARQADRKRESAHQYEAEGPSRIQIEPAPGHE